MYHLTVSFITQSVFKFTSIYKLIHNFPYNRGPSTASPCRWGPQGKKVTIHYNSTYINKLLLRYKHI